MLLLQGGDLIFIISNSVCYFTNIQKEAVNVHGHRMHLCFERYPRVTYGCQYISSAHCQAISPVPSSGVPGPEQCAVQSGWPGHPLEPCPAPSWSRRQSITPLGGQSGNMCFASLLEAAFELEAGQGTAPPLPSWQDEPFPSTPRSYCSLLDKCALQIGEQLTGPGNCKLLEGLRKFRTEK